MLYTSDQLRPWHEPNRSAFNLFHFCSIRSPFALAASALRAKDRKEGTSQQTERGNGREKEAQRAELRAALTDRDAEVDGARGNIDALAAEIGRAREAHGVRDATESALRAEIAALRQSRWFRLGRAIGLLDRGHR